MRELLIERRYTSCERLMILQCKERGNFQKTGSKINDQLKESFKYQGFIGYFNGLTITQSRKLVQINCVPYLRRVFNCHC